MLVITGEKDYVEVQKALEKICYKRQKLRKILGYRIQPQIGKVFDFLKKSLIVISKIDIKGNFLIKNEFANKAGIRSSKDLEKFLHEKEFGLKAFEDEKSKYKKNKTGSKSTAAKIAAKEEYLNYLKEVIEFLEKLAEVFCAHDYRVSLTNAEEDCNLISGIDNKENPFSLLCKVLRNFFNEVEKNFGVINEEVYKKRIKNIDFVNFSDINKVLDDLSKYSDWFRMGDYKLIRKHYIKNYVDKKMELIYPVSFEMQIITRHELLLSAIIKEMGKLIECPNEKNKNVLINAIDEWNGYKTISFDGTTEHMSKIIESLNLQYMFFNNDANEENNANEGINCGNSRPNVKAMAKNLNLAQIEGRSVGGNFFVASKPNAQSSNLPHNSPQNKNIETLKIAMEQLKKGSEYIKDRIEAFNKCVDPDIKHRGDEVHRTICAVC